MTCTGPEPMQMFFMTVQCTQLSLSCFKALFSCFLLPLGCLCCTSLAQLAKVSLMCLVNTGRCRLEGAPVVCSPHGYCGSWQEPGTELNVGVVDNFRLALSW